MRDTFSLYLYFWHFWVFFLFSLRLNAMNFVNVLYIQEWAHSDKGIHTKFRLGFSYCCLKPTLWFGGAHQNENLLSQYLNLEKPQKRALWSWCSITSSTACWNYSQTKSGTSDTIHYKQVNWRFRSNQIPGFTYSKENKGKVLILRFP